MCNDCCRCCRCCCTAQFCEDLWTTVGIMCGGVIVYMVGSIVVVETVQWCCNPYRQYACYISCDQCCKKCKKCCRKKKNVDIIPVEAPSIHIMIRNPDDKLTLGTPSNI